MKKVILGLFAFGSLAAAAASVNLGSTYFSQDASSAVIDVNNRAVVDSVTLAVSGGSVRFEEVRVVFRTGNGSGPYKEAKYRVNRYVTNGGAIALDVPNNGYPIRRIEIDGDASALTGDVLVRALAK